jgi:hypothetical protein
MTTEKPRLRFSLLTLLIGMAFIAFLLAAFSRGNYLLSTGAGITYAVIALMIIVLFTRAMRETPVPKILIAYLILFSVPVCLAFAFPTYINSDVQIFVDRQSEDRVARAELHAVFAEDPAFSDLSISTTHLKVVNVEISGTVPSKADLDRLQQLVFERCGFVEHCFVQWRIRVGNDSMMYVARNDDAFVPE